MSLVQVSRNQVSREFQTYFVRDLKGYRVSFSEVNGDWFVVSRVLNKRWKRLPNGHFVELRE